MARGTGAEKRGSFVPIRVAPIRVAHSDEVAPTPGLASEPLTASRLADSRGPAVRPDRAVFGLASLIFVSLRRALGQV
jgi:hypothetical protein